MIKRLHNKRFTIVLYVCALQHIEEMLLFIGAVHCTIVVVNDMVVVI